MHSTESQESWIMAMIYVHYSRGLTLWQILNSHLPPDFLFPWKLFAVRHVVDLLVSLLTPEGSRISQTEHAMSLS